MWKTLGMLQLDPELSDAAQELMEDTARNVILITAGSYLGLQVLMAVLASDAPSMITWFIMPIVALSAGAALRLLETRFVSAQLIWQAGLALAISLALVLFGRSEIAFLYAMLPFMAVATGGWTAGIASLGLVMVLSLGLAVGLPQALPIGYAFGAIGGAAFAGLIAWAASRTLYTVTQWSLQSFTHVRQQSDAARQHRAQLALALNDLDRAYYRLERTNAALVVAWQTAAEAERFKTEFATNLSHELRTPLNLIIGFCELMITAPHKYGGVSIPGPYRSDLNAIYQNARHLMALVNDVIDLARIDAGKLALQRQPLDLRELVQEVIDMVHEYVTAKGLALHTDIAPELGPVWADRLRIRQVLLNLLINAARFTDDGEITVSIGQNGGEIEIRVSDTGRGIRPGELGRIFDEFTQAGDSRTEGWLASSGLGLPISRRFVELHGGQMGVESIYQQGTTFWFRLPSVRLAGSAAQVAEMPGRNLLHTPPLKPVHAARKLLVVVHDDRRTVSLLQRYMEDYDILSAKTIESGLALAQELKAVAVVADAHPEAVAVDESLLFVSCPLPSAHRAARALGARDLLVKPISSEELWAAIDDLGAPVNSVLIADDDPDMVRLIRRMLVPQIQARHCLAAHTGAEALEIMRAQRPDLVLLDLVMPEIDGYAVLAEMQADPGLHDVAAIIISGQEREELISLPAQPISMWQGERWAIGDLMRVLQANLNALAPSWR